MIIIVISCLIAVCLFAILLNNKEEEIKPISSPKISKRGEKKIIGTTPNGDICFSDDKIRIFNKEKNTWETIGSVNYNGTPIKEIHLMGSQGIRGVNGTIVNDPTRQVSLISPWQSDIHNMLAVIGATYDIEEVFCPAVKNKIYRLFSKEIYRKSRNNEDLSIYTQRCDILERSRLYDGNIIKLSHFKNEGLPFVIDPLGNKIHWQNNIKFINDNGELIKTENVKPLNSDFICHEDNCIYYRANVDSLEKIYAIWCVN